jgi:hypothetical protein
MKSIMANHGRMFVEKTQVLLPQGTNEALKAASGRKYVRPIAARLFWIGLRLMAYVWCRAGKLQDLEPA